MRQSVKLTLRVTLSPIWHPVCEKAVRSAPITGRRLFFAQPRRICYRIKNRNVQLRVFRNPPEPRRFDAKGLSRFGGRDTGPKGGYAHGAALIVQHQNPNADQRGRLINLPRAIRWQTGRGAGVKSLLGWQRRGNAPRGTPAPMDSLMWTAANGAMPAAPAHLTHNQPAQ